jgi:SOS-response transcriptional repressor LexA
MNHMSEPGHVAAPPSFTAKQGQYLAFIHAYTLVLGRPPAEADLQRYFRVTPPSVHGMVLSLERSGLIRREPGRARSISVLVDPMALPPLQPSHLQTVKTLHGAMNVKRDDVTRLCSFWTQWDDQRGARFRSGANIAPQPCIRWIQIKDPNHDAAMRIGREAPGWWVRSLWRP